MEQSLINLKDKLKSAGFKFEASTSLYNPMERFADYVSTKEIVHSKIIADLLNPKGEHQLGNGFLVKFFQAIGINVAQPHFPGSENPFKSVQVNTEYYAPTVLDGIETKGRIDILVLVELGNNKKYALIIENKLNDAPDQDQQLDRYNTYARDIFKGCDILIVYMPRIGDCCDYEDAKVINATMLAQIIDQTLEESVSPHKASIKAYSNYLKNISINNIIMDNAKILGGLTAEDIKQAKAIKEAYDKLPQAFAEYLRKMYQNKGYETQIASNYPNYCYIWAKESYSETHLWLAVGFSHEACYFYVVSNDKNTYADYANVLNVAKSSTSYGDIWLKPVDESLSYIEFKTIPDYKNLTQIINYWLTELDKIALMKGQ